MTQNRTSALDQLLGALCFGAFVGVIWFLVWAWPWWLLAFPAVFVGGMILDPRFRSRIGVTFSAGKVNSVESLFRRRLMRWLLGFGTFSVIICALAVGSEKLSWWLVPILFLASGLRLTSLRSKESGSESNLKSALSDNFFEFLVMAALTLTAYTLVLAWLQTVRLDEVTLDKLREWDKRARELHELLEKHEPGLKTAVAVFCVVVLLRVATSARPAFAGLTTQTTALLAKGTKWLERVSTVVALAASKTFLSINPGGLYFRSASSLAMPQKSMRITTVRSQSRSIRLCAGLSSVGLGVCAQRP